MDAARRTGPATARARKETVNKANSVLTAAASIYQMQGISNVLSKHPEIQLVSNQAADWDATKAKNIAANQRCIIMTGCNLEEGLDVVVEGDARRVNDEYALQRLADAYVA